MAQIILSGTVRSTDPNLPVVAGFRVSALVKRAVKVASRGDAAVILESTGAGVVGTDGTFAFDVGGEGDPQSPAIVTASAPDGLQLRRIEVALPQVAAGPVEVAGILLEVVGLDPVMVPQAAPGERGDRVVLTGRVIDERGTKVAAGLPVVLWGRATAADPPFPLVVTKTQAGGHFSADWVSAKLDSAFGRVAGSADVPIRLDDERLPRRVLLVLDVPDVEGGDDRPPAVPDPSDLTRNPAAFSQDLGGGCINLTTPNRAIEEFTYTLVVRTSEPEVKGLTLGLRRVVSRDMLAPFIQASLMQEAMMAGAVRSDDVADLQNLALDVHSAQVLAASDAPPTLAEIKRAAWLSEVGWVKDLIGAAAAAPPVRQMLDADHPIDWDDTPTIYQAITIARGHVLEFREVWRADGYSLGDLLHSLPLAPGQRRQVAILEWERRSTIVRDESLEFEEQLNAFVGRDRDISEIVGSRLSEETAGGSRNTTWGVAGGIGAGFIGSGFGIFGGVAGGASGSASTSWMDSSRRFSGESLQSLRDRVMQRASSVRDERSTVVQTAAQGETLRAETETVANYNRCHAMTVEYFEVLRHFVVTHELARVRECLFVPLPMSEFNRAKALRWQTPLTAHLRERSLAPAFDAIRRIADNWEGWDYPQSRYSEEAPQVLEGELRISFVLPRPRDKDDGTFQVDMWDDWRPWLWMDPFELWNQFLRDVTAEFNAIEIARRDRQFRQLVAPEIAKRVMDRLRFAYVTTAGTEVPVPLDATLVSRYAEGVPLYVTLRMVGGLPPTPREQIAQFKIWLDGAELPKDSQIVVHNGKVRYETEHKRWLLFRNDRILNDLSNTDAVYVSTPTSWWETRDPRKEDEELADRLVAHLNTAMEFYHQAIWMWLDAERRFMLLDGILVPGLGGKSVASVVENRVIGMAGNSLILPVAPGLRIDSRVSDQSQGDLIDQYATDAPSPLRVSVPTRGVYAEAILGECNACEPIDDARYWRWTTAGMLAPPTIEPVKTDSRAEPETPLTPTPLPTPLVQIQNAPDLPAPVGLGEVFRLLAKPDLFTDITGLEGTQRNARAAFDAALSSASALATQAAQLASQNMTATNGERMLDRIDRAQKDGLLPPGVAQDLSNKVFGSMLAAPDAKADRKAASPVADPEVEKAIDKAAQNDSAQVKVSTVDETIEMRFDGGATGVGAGGALAAVAGKIEVADHWVDVPANKESPVAGGGGIIWKQNPIEKLAALKAAYPAETALIDGKFLRPQAADPTEYEFFSRLRIRYPEDPAKPGKVAGKGKLPVVVLVHGQHESWHSGAEVLNHEGYTYLQDHLASKGIVSVSVDTSAANLWDSIIEMRAQTTLLAIDYMIARDKDKNSPLKGRLDFDRVGLMGHSRGGDTVVRTAILNAAAKKCVIKAVALLAPTDFTGMFGSTDTMAIDSGNGGFLFVLYGGLDGDVSARDGARGPVGTGFRHYDRATAPKAMAYVPGCTHNRFNSVWTADEGRLLRTDLPRVHSRGDHETLAIEYMGALFEWKLKGSAKAASMFNGRATSSLGHDVALLWAWGNSHKVVENFENAAAGTVGTRTVSFADVGPIADTEVAPPPVPGAPVPKAEPHVPHQTSVLAFARDQLGPVTGTLEIELPAPHRDWSAFNLLAFNLGTWIDVSSQASVTAGVAPPDVKVTLVDGAGKSATVGTLGQPMRGRADKPIFHEISTPGGPKNVSLNRLVTWDFALALFAGVDLADVRKLSMAGPLALPQRVFIDAITLVKP